MPIPIISGPYKTFRALNKDETFVEYEGSTITIPFKALMPGGVYKTETLSLTAFMRLEVFPAYVNGLGTREFQFVIRDWELYGFSPLLNELFFNDPLGYPIPGGGREQAVMTFTVSHNYYKKDDDGNEILAPVDFLEIDNITSHDIRDGYIYWQVDEDTKNKGKFSVTFHNKPKQKGQLAKFDSRSDSDFVLAKHDNLAPDDVIGATVSERKLSGIALETGNTTVSAIKKLRQPMSIRWRLGKKPKAGQGRIKIVTPPRSICTADFGADIGKRIDSIDFPARIMYAASYHIFINNVRFVEDQAGVAIAVGVHEIPPRDVKVAFDKPHTGEVLGRYLEFDEGHCTGMHEITEEQFRRGVNYCRYWRTVRLDVTKGTSPSPPPF